MNLGVDCSVPPTSVECDQLIEQHVTVLAGYIGGDTPHVWTPLDWQISRARGFKLIPVWVAPFAAYSHSDGADAGNRALQQMQAAGLQSICCLDVESGYRVSHEYVQGFSDALEAGSCDMMLYGIANQIDGLSGTRLCTWLALPTIPADFLPDAAGMQVRFGERYDWSLWDEEAPGA